MELKNNLVELYEQVLLVLNHCIETAPQRLPAFLPRLIREKLERIENAEAIPILSIVSSVANQLGVSLQQVTISHDDFFRRLDSSRRVACAGSNIGTVLLIEKLPSKKYRIQRSGQIQELRRDELQDLLESIATAGLENELPPELKVQLTVRFTEKERRRLYSFVRELDLSSVSACRILSVMADDLTLWESINTDLEKNARRVKQPVTVLFAESASDFISASEFKHSEEHHRHVDEGHRTGFLSIWKSRPVSRFLSLVKLERRDVLALCGYSVVVSILSLVTPLAIDALVQTISAGTVTLPLVVLSILVTVALLAGGGIGLLQQYIAEVLKQRLFVNTAFEIATKLPRTKADFFAVEYAPELVNRFFDVVTLQKTFSRLLLDGVSAGLLTIAGLFLLALFSPILLAVGIAVALVSFGILIAFGRGGLATSLHESNEKYLVAAALEEVGRCLTSYKLTASPRMLNEKIDELLTQYVRYRRAHFRVLLRQQSSAVFIKTIITSSILVIGGMLVIDRQITLGQLVASQIVILYLVAGVEGLFKQLESVYDMFTAIEKLAQVTGVELERIGGKELCPAEVTLVVKPSGLAVQIRNVAHGFSGREVLRGVTLDVKPGDRLSLVGKSGGGKSLLAQFLVGIDEPTSGSIFLDDNDLRTIELNSLRKHVGLVLAHDELIEASIEENIRMGREWISSADILWALRVVQLEESVFSLPRGLQTRVIGHGKNLSTGMARRVMIARAIVAKPRLLIIDEAFNGIEENIKIDIVQELFGPHHQWSIINITHDPEVVLMSGVVAVLQDGEIVETGSPTELSLNSDSVFSGLFPMQS